VTRRSAAIGRLTANANGAVVQLSDFGTITTIGAGLNWSPAERLNLTASWTREEGPPTLQQLGDPLIETPGVNVFDFATGQTVAVTTLTGGNPGLRGDTRNVLKIGGHWQPFEKTDLSLRAEYVRQSTDDPQASMTISEAMEAAFPQRFSRDANGTLVAVGAGELTHALTTFGLVDEFWFWVSPSLWPAGPRIFDGVGPVRLELIGSTTFGSGVVRLAYRPAPDRQASRSAL